MVDSYCHCFHSHLPTNHARVCFENWKLETHSWAPTIWTKDGSQKSNIFSLYYSWLVLKSHVLPYLLVFRGSWCDNLAPYMVQTWGKIWWSHRHSLPCLWPGPVSPSWHLLVQRRGDNSHLSEPAENLFWRVHRLLSPVLQTICLQSLSLFCS